MKLPVYVERTLELIGVVDVDQGFIDRLIKQRTLYLAELPGPVDFRGGISTVHLSVRRHAIRYCPLRNSHGAQTISLMVEGPDVLKVLKHEARLVWPNKRPKRKRSERRRRRTVKMMGTMTGRWSGGRPNP